MAVPTYAGPLERTWYYAFRVICGLIFFFLIAPIMVMVPLSFNAQPYFTYTREMLSFDPDGYSLRWYREFFNSTSWLNSIRNSVLIAICATLVATSLGTLAALGLSRRHMPFRGLIMGILISPMIVPLIISAAGMFFFLFEHQSRADIHWRHSRPCRARNALRHHHGHRDAGRLRPHADARGSQPRRITGPGVPQDHPAADHARRDFRRAVRLHHFL